MLINKISRISECPDVDGVHSPFMVYTGEDFIEVPPKEYRGHFKPTELDQLILVMTGKLLVVTSIMLKEALARLEVGNVAQGDIQKRLNLLTSAEFLSKHGFVTDMGKAASKVYKLNWRGVGYLKSIGIKPRLGEYLTKSDATHIKRILSVAQYVLKQAIDVESYKMCEIVLVPSKDPEIPTNKIFRPQAVIQTQEGTVFVESVRQNQNWQKEILDKLRRISAVMKARTQNISIQNPTLVLVAETVQHMKDVMELIDLEYFYYTIPILYTADSLVYTEPNRCLYDMKKRNFWETLFAV